MDAEPGTQYSGLSLATTELRPLAGQLANPSPATPFLGLSSVKLIRFVLGRRHASPVVSITHIVLLTTNTRSEGRGRFPHRPGGEGGNTETSFAGRLNDK